MADCKTGAPPRYTSKEEIQGKIDAYFKACEGEPLIVDGVPAVDKYGEVIMVGKKPYTVTGLALALGFNSRQTLLNYQGKEEFMDTIIRAKSRIEQYTEERLFDKDGVNGAKFSLSNNFEGWREKQQVEAEVNSEVNINIELSDD